MREKERNLRRIIYKCKVIYAKKENDILSSFLSIPLPNFSRTSLPFFSKKRNYPRSGNFSPPNPSNLSLSLSLSLSLGGCQRKRARRAPAQAARSDARGGQAATREGAGGARRQRGGTGWQPKREEKPQVRENLP